MADDTKRVSLIFKADGTVDFQKSLKDVNAAVNENRSAFKLAKSEWDENTSALTKLRDTQEYLATQTDAYSDKVKRLTEILATQESAENKNEAAISKTREQLNNAKATLNNYQSGLEDVEKKLKSGAAQMEEYAKKISDLGDKATNAGKKLSAGITAPILAIGTASGVAWKELDEAYDNIAAGTGAVGDKLQGLQDSFDNVYGNFPSDSETVSNAISGLNTRFGFTGSQLEDASTKFIKFADVGKTDVSTAIQDVSRYMGDASIESSKYSEVLDSLISASQNSGIAITTLTEDLTKYGAPMRALGFETQESIALFSQWEKAGVNTEIAFSGMKKAISNWSAEGKDARTEFKATLQQIADAPDIASATTQAIEIFGAKAGPDLADAIKGGRFSIEEFMNVVNNSGGQLDATFEAMEDGPDKAKIALNNLKLAGADLAQTAITDFGPTLINVINDIKEFTQWFKNLNESTKQTTITIALVMATLGPLLIIFGKTASGISSIIKLAKDIGPILTTLKTIIASVNATMAANPILAIVVVIAIIIAAIILLYNNCEWFRNGVNAIGESIKNAFFSVWNPIKGFFTTTIPEIFNAVIDFVKNNWQGLLLFIVNPFAGAFKLLYDNCAGFRNFIDGFVDGIKEAWGKITEPFREAIQGIRDAWQWLKDAIKLPHFSIDGSFSLSPPSVPHLGVDWYANGGILNSPTIFGMNNGKLLGGGEAGQEAVLPINTLLEYMNQSNSESNNQLLNALAQLLPDAFVKAILDSNIIAEVANRPAIFKINDMEMAYALKDPMDKVMAGTIGG